MPSARSDAAVHRVWLLTPVQALLFRTSDNLSEYDLSEGSTLRATSVTSRGDPRRT
jgi:hypothetical protein